jgi:hypothetical protein
VQNPQSDFQCGGNAADRNDAYRSVVTDLVALIDHVQASLRSIEQEIARETASGSQQTSFDVIELDDVTPPYVRPRR